MKIENIEKSARDFYLSCSKLAHEYRLAEMARFAYDEKHPCMVVVFVCEDERERDFPDTMGLPFGYTATVETAGNRHGVVNFGLRRLMEEKLSAASFENKRVLVFFVTHSSVEKPESDSCAAWGHKTKEAKLDAERQVWQFNHRYGDSTIYGVARPCIAIHIHSYTDSEAKVWCNERGEELDPRDIAGRLIEVDDRDLATKTARNEGMLKLSRLFPQDDARFTGMSIGEWQDVLGQCADMFAANAMVVRDVMLEKREASKAGHKGVRVLVGDWPLHNEPNEYFKISLAAADLGVEDGIAGTYVGRNLLVRSTQIADYRPSIGIHVNREYTGEMDRKKCEDEAIEIAQALRDEWDDLLHNPYRKEGFEDRLKHALADAGVTYHDLPPQVLEILERDPLSMFHFYISVSSAETKAVEFVREL